MTRTVDLSDDWSTEHEHVSGSDREQITATHNDTDVSMVAKEQPNGAELRLQIPADLPGGYDVIHDIEFQEIDRTESVADDELDAAISELERFGAMYDTEETWLVEGAPILH